MEWKFELQHFSEFDQSNKQTASARLTCNQQEEMQSQSEPLCHSEQYNNCLGNVPSASPSPLSSPRKLLQSPPMTSNEIEKGTPHQHHPCKLQGSGVSFEDRGKENSSVTPTSVPKAITPKKSCSSSPIIPRSSIIYIQRKGNSFFSHWKLDKGVSEKNTRRRGQKRALPVQSPQAITSTLKTDESNHLPYTTKPQDLFLQDDVMNHATDNHQNNLKRKYPNTGSSANHEMDNYSMNCTDSRSFDESMKVFHNDLTIDNSLVPPNSSYAASCLKQNDAANIEPNTVHGIGETSIFDSCIENEEKPTSLSADLEHQICHGNLENHMNGTLDETFLPIGEYDDNQSCHHIVP